MRNEKTAAGLARNALAYACLRWAAHKRSADPFGPRQSPDDCQTLVPFQLQTRPYWLSRPSLSCQHAGSRNNWLITQCPACAQHQCRSCRHPFHYCRRLLMKGPAPCHPAARACQSRVAANPPARTPCHVQPHDRAHPRVRNGREHCTLCHAVSVRRCGFRQCRRHRSRSSSASVATCSFAGDCSPGLLPCRLWRGCLQGTGT